MKVRIDQLIFENGQAESREKAKRIIMAGSVFINDLKIDKPGTKVDDTSVIEIRGKKLKYVSRGGLKLEKAILEYGLNLDDKVCMDVGASTGGFTDCMLQNKAKKVFAIDVGYGQLAYQLRTHPRVVNLEKTNMRYLEYETIGEKIDFISIDVAFISLDKIIPVLEQFAKPNSQMVALIKPQFEAGREKVKKNGVVRDADVHIDVIRKITTLLHQNHWEIIKLTFSPIKGPKGNIEYLAFCERREHETEQFDDELIKKIVVQSHDELL